jgi:hypothetical protein
MTKQFVKAGLYLTGKDIKSKQTVKARTLPAKQRQKGRADCKDTAPLPVEQRQKRLSRLGRASSNDNKTTKKLTIL